MICFFQQDIQSTLKLSDFLTAPEPSRFKAFLSYPHLRMCKIILTTKLLASYIKVNDFLTHPDFVSNQTFFTDV